jgi:hypothetical protein
LRLLEPHQRDLEVPGRAQEIHDLHHFAIGHRLVRAQEDACVLVALCGSVDIGGVALFGLGLSILLDHLTS